MRQIDYLSNALSNNCRWWYGYWCVLAVALIGICPIPAQAALTVSPARVVLQAKAGHKATGFFSLENPGDVPLLVLVQPEDWTYGMRRTHAAVPWLTVHPAKLILSPGQRGRVQYVARVPTQASGELRAQVFFTTEIPGSVAMHSRLGAMLYVDIAGTERPGGEVTHTEMRYTAATPGVERPDQLEILLTIRNRGNVHLVPEGQVFVRDATQHTVVTLTLKPGWALLPNEQDVYRVVEHGVHLKSGVYAIDIQLIGGADLHHSAAVAKTVAMTVDEQGRVHQAASPSSSSQPSSLR